MSRASAGRLRVLVVDDDQIMCEAIALALADSFDVTAANGALEALELLEERRPDIVISDYRMPHLDGLWLLARVRERDRAIGRVLISADSVERVVLPRDGVVHCFVHKCMIAEAIERIAACAMPRTTTR